MTTFENIIETFTASDGVDDNCRRARTSVGVFLDEVRTSNHDAAEQAHQFAEEKGKAGFQLVGISGDGECMMVALTRKVVKRSS